MHLTPEQEQKARERFVQEIKGVGEEEVEYAAKKGYKKLEELFDDIPNALQALWEDLKLMIELIKDYYDGTYREIPWKSVAAIVGAVVYFISPIDVIPDFIPVIGYLDDALVIKLALDLVHDDLLAYQAWKATKA